MNSRKITFLAIVAVFAAAMITSTVFNNVATAQSTKKELRAEIKKDRAEIKALQVGGVTADEKAQIKKLRAEIRADLADLATTTGSNNNTHQTIKQSNSATQSPSCSGGNHTNSCNNTATQSNTNSGSNTH